MVKQPSVRAGRSGSRPKPKRAKPGTAARYNPRRESRRLRDSLREVVWCAVGLMIVEAPGVEKHQHLIRTTGAKWLRDFVASLLRGYTEVPEEEVEKFIEYMESSLTALLNEWQSDLIRLGKRHEGITGLLDSRFTEVITACEVFELEAPEIGQLVNIDQARIRLRKKTKDIHPDTAHDNAELQKILSGQQTYYNQQFETLKAYNVTCLRMEEM